jgi:hypothetical protein
MGRLWLTIGIVSATALACLVVFASPPLSFAAGSPSGVLLAPPPPPPPPPPSPSPPPPAGGGGGGGGGRHGPPGPSGEITGYVTDLTTGQPGRGIKVCLNNAVVTTDSDGRYSLTGAMYGDYTVQLDLGGQGTPAQDPIVVASDGKSVIGLDLDYYSGPAPLKWTPTPPPPPAPPAAVTPVMPHTLPPGVVPAAPAVPGANDAPLLGSGDGGQTAAGWAGSFGSSPYQAQYPGSPGNSGMSSGNPWLGATPCPPPGNPDPAMNYSTCPGNPGPAENPGAPAARRPAPVPEYPYNVPMGLPVTGGEALAVPGLAFVLALVVVIVGGARRLFNSHRS